MTVLTETEYGLYGPYVDHEGNSDTNLLFVYAMEADDYKGNAATIASPLYQNSDSFCDLSFWYYSHGDTDGGDLIPTILHEVQHNRLQ